MSARVARIAKGLAGPGIRVSRASARSWGPLERPARLGDIRQAAALAAHGLAADTRLPGELELADQYGVSRDTIRRAIQELVTEDRLIVLHGRGTFVTRKG